MTSMEIMNVTETNGNFGDVYLFWLKVKRLRTNKCKIRHIGICVI
jgi:hypothetical protein